MNYRHAYHAGNFADVLKHSVLFALIQALQAKDTPFALIDTHAGSGCYALDSEEAGCFPTCTSRRTPPARRCRRCCATGSIRFFHCPATNTA
jgi:hypothetical protein